jgi:uncharacterized integral membrane protein
MIPSPHPEEVLEMLSKTRGTPVYSPAPGVIPDTITGPVTDGSPVATAPEVAPAPAAAATASGGETRGQHFRRKAHRTRLHGYAVVAVALVAFLIALAASNTAHVKVNWVVGSSHVSLVWLVLFAAILGWLLGLVATAAFHWRTRAPRHQRGATS